MSSSPIMRSTSISSHEVDVVGQHAAPRSAASRMRAMSAPVFGLSSMPMRASIRCGLVVGDGVLEGDVAGGEPHLVVAGLVLEAGLVAGVGLEQAAAEVGDGGAGDVLVEQRC